MSVRLFMRSLLRSQSPILLIFGGLLGGPRTGVARGLVEHVIGSVQHLSFTSTPVRIWLVIGPYSTANRSNSTVLLTVRNASSKHDPQAALKHRSRRKEITPLIHC